MFLETNSKCCSDLRNTPDKHTSKRKKVNSIYFQKKTVSLSLKWQVIRWEMLLNSNFEYQIKNSAECTTEYFVE